MSPVVCAGRRGTTLVELLVAIVLLAVAGLVWSTAFANAMGRLDEAHLGLHAAILATQAARSAGEVGSVWPVGPGSMVVESGTSALEVRYEPPTGAAGGTRPYQHPRAWRIVP